MHARLCQGEKSWELHHPTSFGVLLTASIKKHCLDLLKSLGYDIELIEFIENEVSEAPIQIQSFLEQQLYQNRRAEMLNQPLAQFIVQQPGFKLIQSI